MIKQAVWLNSGKQYIFISNRVGPKGVDNLPICLRETYKACMCLCGMTGKLTGMNPRFRTSQLIK